MFKQTKDIRDMVRRSPDQLGERDTPASLAEARSRARTTIPPQHTPQAETAGAPGDAGDETRYSPIAGVSLETYAAVSQRLAAYDHDPSRAPEIALTLGIDSASWRAAMIGWNARIQSDRVIGRRFSLLISSARSGKVRD
jgi:hypothetical protein